MDISLLFKYDQFRFSKLFSIEICKDKQNKGRIAIYVFYENINTRFFYLKMNGIDFKTLSLAFTFIILKNMAICDNKKGETHQPLSLNGNFCCLFSPSILFKVNSN